MDEPVFNEPWHAQLFAMTTHLSQVGVFTWPEWAECFGATLKRHGLAKELDGGDDYFTAWLEALEAMLKSKKLAVDKDILEMVGLWRDAYLQTPHGQPVSIAS
jgi:nitrile hydratase accessory protein